MTYDDMLREVLTNPPTREQIKDAVATLASEPDWTLSSAKQAANEVRRAFSEGGRDCSLSDLLVPLSRPDRAKPWFVRIQVWDGDACREDTHPGLGRTEGGAAWTVQGSEKCQGLPGVARYIAQALKGWDPELPDIQALADIVFSNSPSWRQTLSRHGSYTYHVELPDGGKVHAYIQPAKEIA
jgi:hypothetical protein